MPTVFSSSVRRSISLLLLGTLVSLNGTLQLIPGLTVNFESAAVEGDSASKKVSRIYLNIWTCNFLMSPPVRRSDGQWSVIISFKGGKLHLHASSGPLVE